MQKVIASVVMVILASLSSCSAVAVVNHHGAGSKEETHLQRLAHIQEHLKSLSKRLSLAEAVDSSKKAEPDAKIVPGTPALEEPMGQKAPEQGFTGKDVQHIDQETHTGDWQKEYKESKSGSKSSGAVALTCSMGSLAAALAALLAVHAL
mmetsp:Transcript_72330/g.172382  ORF Transcript_72330/g.172382 Transcript_72330/m.172382 type:complete len:150 (+) Transcript_72330:90-539(+)|eukprot:CAMPEP_0178430872 /NCGR_PEP_ID=MMETSP0689_2-20121128/31545_1 /TAXON_ID=160604 /ORGANISM="Amphidinium massartii, Strain CS-259" /LENGTH=149 /DNA_ID=CAMNT_0020052745 /DNA_START=94 /DNA_END=543 /DNA_ORIENTATION=+